MQVDLSLVRRMVDFGLLQACGDKNVLPVLSLNSFEMSSSLRFVNPIITWPSNQQYTPAASVRMTRITQRSGNL